MSSKDRPDGLDAARAASWRAQNGEIIGTPKAPAGGWLVLNKSYQDVALFTNLTCLSGCKAGLLLRAEKTPEGGMKGVFVSLTEGEPGSFAVQLDAQGKEIGREPLPAGGRAGGGGGELLRQRRGAAAAGGGGAAAAPGGERVVAVPAAPPAPARRRAGGGQRASGSARWPAGALRRSWRRGGGAPAPGLPPGVGLPGLARRPAPFARPANSVDITLANTA